MISYRQADILERMQKSDPVLGVVRVVVNMFGQKRCITGYQLEINRETTDDGKRKALVGFADDLWTGLPAPVTNSYLQNPIGFSSPFRGDLQLTMVSEDHGSGLQPSPQFIETAIEVAFKKWGIFNAHPDEEVLHEGANGVSIYLMAEYPIKYSQIPESFKVVKADLLDNMNRKKEWKEHRIQRAAKYLSDLWKRYWGVDAEFHSPKEMVNILQNEKDSGFRMSIREEQPLMIDEVKEFFADPETRKAFLTEIERIAREGGWTGPLGLREASLSIRHSDLLKTKELMDHTPMIVDMLHTSAGMTVLDHVYEKDKRYTPMIDEKIDHLKSIIRATMQEMGIWFNRHQNHERQQGFNNIVKIMKRVKEDPRVESITENFTLEEVNRNHLQHFLYTVVMK